MSTGTKIIWCFSVLLYSVLALEVEDLSDEMKAEFERTYPNHIAGPKSINDRILIVGAGVSGIHMAHLLKQAGFKNVVIYENTNEIGGKSSSMNHRGVVHEMGALYLTKDYTNSVLKLVNTYTNNSLVIPPFPSVWYANNTKQLPLPKYLFLKLKQMYPSKNISAIQRILARKIRKYIKLHMALFGQYSTELMSEPNNKTKHKIRGTFGDFLKRNQLAALSELFTATFVVQGYGRLDEVPALYGLMWNTPVLMRDVAEMIQGKGSAIFGLSKGFQNLWMSLAKKTNYEIKLRTDIYRIRRHLHNSKKKHLVFSSQTRHGKKVNRLSIFDFIIWSPNAKQLFSLLSIRFKMKEEQNLFHGLKPTYYTTSLLDLRLSGPSQSHINWYMDNIQSNGESVWASRDGYSISCQNRIINCTDENSPLKSFVFYQYGKHNHSTLFLREKLFTHLNTSGITDAKVLKMVQWPYFHRPDAASIEKGYHWRVLELQGDNNIWFIGGSVSFESVKSVVEYNMLLLSRLKNVTLT